MEEKVSEEIGKKYGKEINVVFKRISTSNGSGIADLFDELIDKYFIEFKDQINKDENIKKDGPIKIIKVDNNKKSTGF